MSSGGGSSKGNGSIVINNITKVEGNDLINTREWKRQMKLEIGKHRDRFM